MTSSTGGGSWFEGSDGSSGSPTALRFLHELSALIAGSENLNKALRATLERICTVCAWPYGEAWIADEATQTLRRGPAWDGQRHELMALAAATPNLALGEELPGAAFAAGQTVWWPDLRNVSSPRLGDALSLGLRAGVAVPMIA
jgi:hypothetical protein